MAGIIIDCSTGEIRSTGPGEDSPTTPPVPQIVSPRQLKLALLDAGLLDDVEAFVASADRAVRIQWENTIEFHRQNLLLNQMAVSFGLEADQVDDLFRAASTL